MGRENLRATIGGSGFAARRAKAAAAAEAAVNTAATAVEEATSGGGGGGGSDGATGSRLPRKSSTGIPRKVPGTAAAGAGASRLTAPAASGSSRFAGRSSSIGGSGVGGGGRSVAGAGAALRTVQVAADYDGEEDHSGAGSAGSAAVDGSTKPQGEGAVAGGAGGRRSFIPRPSPKAGRSLIPRRSGRA